MTREVRKESIPIPKLINCARCGEEHVDLAFEPLTRPVLGPVGGEAEATHWCPCPSNGEPIIMLAPTE